MVITNKNRKLLWGPSGNKCAFCKCELVMAATEKDSESIIGDECHIISEEINGPRYDQNYPSEKLNSSENLILLCRIHHKLIDDQPATFTAEILSNIKKEHKKWVSQKLSENTEIPPVKIRRIKGNKPDYLIRITGGKQLLNLVEGAHSSQCDHDELNSQKEVELLGELLDLVRDYIDLRFDMEPSHKVDLSFRINQLLMEIENSGFFVFGAREKMQMEGGIGNTPTPWENVIIRIVRQSNAEILKFESE